jgi:hypothetical protein
MSASTNSCILGFVLTSALLSTGCGKRLYLDTPEGVCVADVRVVTSKAGVPVRLESCGEVLLRVEWDLNRDGVFDCRMNQFTPDEGLFLLEGNTWRPAPPNFKSPPFE